MINFNWVPPSFWLMPTMGRVCMAVIASLIVSPSAGYISSFLTWWVGCEIAQQEGTAHPKQELCDMAMWKYRK